MLKSLQKRAEIARRDGGGGGAGMKGSGNGSFFLFTNWNTLHSQAHTHIHTGKVNHTAKSVLFIELSGLQLFSLKQIPLQIINPTY